MLRIYSRPLSCASFTNRELHSGRVATKPLQLVAAILAFLFAARSEIFS